jgi:hypothetical protein
MDKMMNLNFLFILLDEIITKIRNSEKAKNTKSIIVELSELPLFIKVKDKRETKEYVLKGQVNKENKISVFLNKKEY